MKKILLVAIIFIGAIAQSNAQEADKFRFDFDLGYAIPQGGDGGGLVFYLEPKWNIKDNVSVGFRGGGAALIKNVEFSNIENEDPEVGFNASYLLTSDYYFHNGTSSFAPFVGGGFGFYTLANIATSEEFDEDGNKGFKLNGKLGAMLRAGFNWAGFKMTLDYNFVGESDLQNFNGEVVGTSKNGYLGVSLGFFVGGGKWGR